ncbi:MAG: MBL fold metallo-hydrolase [Bdellovibrionia bacterium]
MRLKRFVYSLLFTGVLLGLIAYSVFQLPTFGGSFDGERLERMKKSRQWVNGRFENDPPQSTELGLIKTMRRYSEGQIREPTFEVPVQKLTPADLPVPPPPGLRAYWFGHASVLIDIDGTRVMTDPILSEYASPFHVGPRRLHTVPIDMRDLPKVDAVVISHDHYDHLDMDTVRAFAAKGTHFYVGLGIGAHLERWNIPPEQIHEMDWWESLKIGDVEIHCTPARHYSGRKRMNNSTLWASWFVKGPKHSFYFSGDTGYAPHFEEIGKRLGGPDLALIKVGAYGETWLDIHMAPEPAVQAARDLKAKFLLPVHWATFNLAYHSWDEPILRTLAEAAHKKVELLTPRPGEKIEFGKPFENTKWYQP